MSDEERYWVITEICKEPSAVKRVKIIKQFIRIASEYRLLSISPAIPSLWRNTHNPDTLKIDLQDDKLCRRYKASLFS